MASIVFQTALTAEENQYYTKKFNELDPERLGIVTGEAIRPLLASSGLPTSILSQIWATVDINQQGFLNFNEFGAAMRIIGHVQQNHNILISKDLYASPPYRLAIIGASSGSQVPNQSQVPVQSISIVPIPPIAPHDVNNLSALFDRTANGAIELSGSSAREIFMNAPLDTQILGGIWALCDRNDSGSVNKLEFLMAMHLISLAVAKSPSVTPLPQSIPQATWDSMQRSLSTNVAASPVVPNPAQVHVTGNSTGNSFSNNPTMPGTVQRQSTITRLSSGAFTSASNDWLLTPEKKQQFDAIFDSLDKSKAGRLSSQVLVPFFVSSKLGQDVLATIWDLADIHNSTEFTKVEFAIAMFLIQKKNAGIDLPDVIPNQLMHSPVLGLVQQPQQNVQAQQMSILPTDPFGDQQAASLQQSQNTGSLSDLLALNSSFHSSLQPTSPQQQTQQFFAAPQEQPAQPVKKFTPTSNFGQSIIREEDEYETPVQQQPVQQQPVQQQPVQQQPVQQQPVQQQPVQQQPVQQQPVQQQPVQQQPVQQQPVQQQPVQQQPVQQQPVQVPVQTPTQSSIPQQTSSDSGFAQFQNKSATARNVPAAIQRTPSVSLKAVPNFGTFGGAVGAAIGGTAAVAANLTTDLFADSKSSGELSQATTELANLSNQVNSLSKQAALTTEKKNKASAELKKLDEAKLKVENRINALRAAREQNLIQTQKLDSALAQTTKENTELEAQLQALETSHSKLQTDVSTLTDNLTNTQFENSQLKTEIVKSNDMTKSLTEQLRSKQIEVRNLKATDDIKVKDLPLDSFTAVSVESELATITDKLSVYISKQKELDDYERTIELQHENIEKKFKELEERKSDIEARNVQYKERLAQVEQQEGLYQQHVTSLNIMSNDLMKRKATFDEANVNLRQQHLDYVQKVNDIKERGINPVASLDHHTHDEQVSKFVDDSVANSSLGTQNFKVPDESILPTTQTASSISEPVSAVADDWEEPTVTTPVGDSTIVPVEPVSSDSDSDDEVFQDTREDFINSYEETGDDIHTIGGSTAATTSGTTGVLPQLNEKDDFEDDFAGLEQADLVNGNDVSFDNGNSMEEFENIDADDLAQELENTEFSTFNDFPPVTTPNPSNNAVDSHPTNNEWDNLFTGFGNEKTVKKNDTTVPAIPDSQGFTPTQPTINRALATTPKSLAMEELAGMGFSQEEAKSALEKNNWDLDAATNYLLDSA